MNETRPFKWVLGNFATGELINTTPMDEIGGGEIDISVDNSDSADIEISLVNASSAVKNSWTSYYKEVLHFAACQNTDTNEIVWAGMINKISPNLKARSLNLQLVNPKEYMAARIVGENFGVVIENPNAGIKFTGDSWEDVISNIVIRCFAPISGSSTAQPPNILGTITPTPTSGVVEFEVLFSDAMSYQEAMDAAITASGEDLETRFTARRVGSRVVWDFRVGTMNNPHLNDGAVLELDINLIDDDDLFKISEFQSDIDSTELYNSFYISSKTGDSETSKGMDLKNATLSSGDFPILLEKYYNPGVELSESQLNSQMNSWISKGLETKRSGSISLELEDARFKTWASSYLGRIISFVGYDDTISAGNTAKLRIVGVRLSTETGRVIIDLMSKMNRYPRLPRKKASGSKKDDKNSQSPSNKLIKQRDIKNIKPGGGGSTVPPWEGGGAWPPSDAGPGGANGTGSNSVKDDDSPYEITNYGKAWNMSSLGNFAIPSEYTAQNQGNIVCQIKHASGATHTWTADQIGIQSINNSSYPNSDIFVGTGYLLEGELLSFDPERFTVEYSIMLDNILMNKSSWGVEFADEMTWGTTVHNYLNISTISRGTPKPFFIRGKIVLANVIQIAARYENSESPGQFNEVQKTFTMFSSVNMVSWNQIGGLDLIPNATIKNSAMTNIATRVGDYGIIETETSFYVNDFNNSSSINEFNWYTIPKVYSIDGINLNYQINPKGVIGKVKVDGVYRNYLIARGGSREENGSYVYYPQKVFGIELMQGHQPIPIADSDWFDISDFFPVPAVGDVQRSYSVDSVGGFLIYRIGGISNVPIYEEVYMQGENGAWHKLQTVDSTIISIGPISFQHDKYVYYTQSGNFTAQPKAFSLKKIAAWALDDPTDP